MWVISFKTCGLFVCLLILCLQINTLTHSWMLSSHCNEGRRLRNTGWLFLCLELSNTMHNLMFYFIQYPSRATFIIIFFLLVLLLFYTHHKTPLKLMLCPVNLLSTTRYWMAQFFEYRLLSGTYANSRNVWLTESAQSAWEPCKKSRSLADCH